MAGVRRDVTPPLIGRDRELEQLLAALLSPPAVVVVEGEAGIGKTRLVTAATADPRLADRRLIAGACRRIREPFPLGPFVEAVRDLGAVLADRTATDQLSPVAGALRGLLPELSDVLPPAPEPLGDRAAERHRIFRGLVEVLGSSGPSVVVVEDLHWADEQTVEFLSYLLAEPPQWLSVVLTFRGEEVHPAVRAVTARLPASVTRAHAVLSPLDADEVGVLMAAALGADRISPEFADRVWQRSSGLPFVVLELLALLQERGQLTQYGGRWIRRTLEELDVPAGVADPVRERVAGLPPPARAVVEAAAVLQEPATLTTLHPVCGLPAKQLRAGTAQAVAAGLLVEQPGGQVGFRHGLAAQAVYEDIVGPRRQELHERAATAVSQLDPVPLGQFAHHLRHAGMVDQWVAAAMAAADHAVGLGDDAEAARLWEDILRHGRLDPAASGQVALKLVASALYAPRVKEMTYLLLEIADRDLPRAVRGELRMRASGLLRSTGADPALCYRLGRAAVDDLTDLPDRRGLAMLDLALPHGATIPIAEHRSWLRRALRILPDLSDLATASALLSRAMTGMLMIGDPNWRVAAAQIDERIAGLPRDRAEVAAYYSIGSVASHSGHHQTAERLLQAGFNAPIIEEVILLGVGLRCGWAHLDYYRGHWDRLRERVDRLLDELSGRSLVYLDVEAVAGCLRLADGELTEARQSLLSIARRTEQAGHIDILPLPVAALARIASIRPEPEPLAIIDRFIELVTAKGAWPSVLRAVPPVTSALLVDDRAGQARGFLDQVRAGLGDLDAPLAAAAVPHAEGLLHGHERRWPQAVRALLTAASHYLSLHCAYEAAQAREQAAAALFTLGDRQAEPTLRAAIDGYQRLAAQWDLERAASLARRYGVSTPARHRGGPRGYGSRLSPREQEVARLAATGRTNREIAAELFLSVKTVDKHLSAVLRKLGLRSRTALAHQVNELAGDGADRNGEFSP